MTARHLATAPEPPDDDAVVGFEARHRIARALRNLADVAERHAPFTVGGVRHGPPRAALVVLVDADGRPCPVVSGDLSSLPWDVWCEVIADAHQALRDFGTAPSSAPHVPATYEDRYGYVNDNWERREQYRADEAQRRADAAAARPFPCGCGYAARTEAGLATHRRGRRHILWEQRHAHPSNSGGGSSTY